MPRRIANLLSIDSLTIRYPIYHPLPTDYGHMIRTQKFPEYGGQVMEKHSNAMGEKATKQLIWRLEILLC